MSNKKSRDSLLGIAIYGIGKMRTVSLCNGQSEVQVEKDKMFPVFKLVLPPRLWKTSDYYFFLKKGNL